MKKILFAVVAIVLLVFAYFMFGNYSTGERAGTVSKLSQRGFIFKTYEGELNVGGLSGETGSPASALWGFSIYDDDEEVIKQLQEALLNGKRVRLYYHEKYVRFFWQGDSKYYVYKVEHLLPKK